MESTMIAGIILAAIGVIFILNYKAMAKGTSNFYKKLYTEKNMRVMFRAAGILLIIGSMILMLR